MVYKIALASTNGTGKSSLAGMVKGELKRRGIEAEALPEMSTEAIKNGLTINENTTFGTQAWILHLQFAHELQYSESTTPPHYEVIICDRGPDNYCYLERGLEKNGLDKEGLKREYALRMTLGHMKQFPYDKIYLLPIISNDLAVGTGARSLDQEFREDMDVRIRSFLDKYYPKFQELDLPKEGDPYRNQWVKDVVNQTLEDLGKTENLIP